jgi:hypothetical protein
MPAQVAVSKTGWPDKTMRKRHPRLAKIHRNHKVEDVASVLAVHRNTVRQWVKSGLPTRDKRRGR